MKIESVPRGAEGIACECDGYMDRVETTADERDEFMCGNCCARAFVCRICHKRKAYKAEAPEME